MSFTSIKAIIDLCESNGRPINENIRDADCRENGYSPEFSENKTAELWNAIKQSSESYNGNDRSNSKLSGGDARLIKNASDRGSLIGGRLFLRVIEEALKVAECNACMKRIVAAPTAGSCGVLPAVLIPIKEEYGITDAKAIEALYVAAGFGQVTAVRASVSGAEGGCQAEIGTASAMAAAALTHIFGGTPSQCADAFAIALGNLLGLVCDPVAGLVEIPCIKRNVVGAVGALAAADMALSGIKSRIPADEVIDAMGEVGRAMPASLRETALGGLAATPTAIKITEDLRKKA